MLIPFMGLYLHLKILLSCGNTNRGECISPLESVVSARGNSVYLRIPINSLFLNELFILCAENLKRFTMVFGKCAFCGKEEYQMTCFYMSSEF